MNDEELEEAHQLFLNILLNSPLLVEFTEKIWERVLEKMKRKRDREKALQGMKGDRWVGLAGNV